MRKLVHIILWLFSFLSMLEPAVSVASGSELVSARQWIEINTMDKVIKALFVPFVTTGWGLKQSVFYQSQRCDETWLTQEANGIKAPICQPCSGPDRSKGKKTKLNTQTIRCFYYLLTINYSIVGNSFVKIHWHTAEFCKKKREESVFSYLKYTIYPQLSEYI